MYTVPIVVPPVAEKGSWYQKVFDPLWARASEIVQDSDTMVVYGFSMPETDVNFRYLLHRMMGRRRDNIHVEIIDPSSQSASRFWDIIQPVSMSHVANVSDMLERRVSVSSEEDKRFMTIIEQASLPGTEE